MVLQPGCKQRLNMNFFVHCNARCLNLVIVDAVKAVSEAQCFFSLLQKLYVYVSGSYVHQKWPSVQKDMYRDALRELQTLSDTRWACRYHACKNLMDRLPAVLRVLHEIDVENSGERSVEARGLVTQIDLTFIGTLAVFRKILGDTKLLSNMLQAPSIDLARAVDLIQAPQQTLEQYRYDSCYDEIWQLTVETAKQCNIAAEAAEKRLPKSSWTLKLEAFCLRKQC